MKTNTIDEAKLREILTRLLADVDDNMEFAGTYWKTKDGAAEQVRGSLNEAVAGVNALAAEAVAAKTAYINADLAWCLGKLRGLGHPAEHLEGKYTLLKQKEKI